MANFELRQPTKKYHLLHERYAIQDREDMRAIAVEFAETFGISYEKIKMRKGGFISYSTDDSDYYGKGTSSVAVPIWIVIRWANIYHSIETYPSDHLHVMEEQ